jgi:hypothetical protein
MFHGRTIAREYFYRRIDPTRQDRSSLARVAACRAGGCGAGHGSNLVTVVSHTPNRVRDASPASLARMRRRSDISRRRELKCRHRALPLRTAASSQPSRTPWPNSSFLLFIQSTRIAPRHRARPGYATTLALTCAATLVSQQKAGSAPPATVTIPSSQRKRALFSLYRLQEWRPRIRMRMSPRLSPFHNPCPSPPM